jgi:hypothetical protein
MSFNLDLALTPVRFSTITIVGIVTTSSPANGILTSFSSTTTSFLLAASINANPYYSVRDWEKH